MCGLRGFPNLGARQARPTGWVPPRPCRGGNCGPLSARFPLRSRGCLPLTTEAPLPVCVLRVPTALGPLCARRIAVFSVTVLHDERIVIVAEQRPDSTEEDSFQWMSRVLQVALPTARPPASLPPSVRLWPPPATVPCAP